jgi:hypothetical protein
MKKSYLFYAFLIFGTIVMAQDIPNHALGLRLGDSDGFGAEISYQTGFSDINRIEVDLGWGNGNLWNGYKLSGLFHWVNHLDGSFNWYYGFGGGLGSVDYKPAVVTDSDGGLFIFGAGNIGIEYQFEIPLILSLDFRPELGIIGYDGALDNLDFDIGLGIRYVF